MPAIAELGIWNPVTCFAACAAVYVIGEWLSRLCKGNISSLMFASAIFLLGFWFDIFPDDVTTAPGLAAAMSNFGVGLLIVNLGTLIDLEDMIKEWKTVVVSLLGMVGVVIGAFSLGPCCLAVNGPLPQCPPPPAAPSPCCWCRTPPTPPAVRR